MPSNQHQHHTRSMADSQKLLVLGEGDHKPKQETATDVSKQESVDISLQMEIMAVLQQILEENKRLKQDMVTQQMAINQLCQKMENLQETKILDQPNLSIKQHPSAMSSQFTAPPTCDKEVSLKEKAARQLQSKRINQLLDSTPFSGTASQEVSDWIEDFNSKCDQVQLEDHQRLSVAVDLLNGNAKLWYEMYKDTIDSWETFKEKLMAYFKLVTGTGQFQLEQKLYNRRRQQNESAIDYCHNVLKLCSKVNKNMNEEIRLKHLIKGLSATAKLHMDSKGPSTTEEFLETLLKHNKWQAEEKSQEKSMGARSRQRNALQQSYNLSSTQQEHQYSSQQQEPHYSPCGPTQATHTNNEMAYRGCWSCGGLDHYRRECPKNY